jgi:hypothetical protein
VNNYAPRTIPVKQSLTHQPNLCKELRASGLATRLRMTEPKFRSTATLGPKIQKMSLNPSVDAMALDAPELASFNDPPY